MNNTAPGVNDRYKRRLDLLVIGITFVFLLPLWILIGVLIPLAIWLEDRGRIFYVQDRLGRAGRPFRIIKFRTMVEDAELETGPVRAHPQDRRTTRVGKILRHFHLDELPQVVNILKGEMSLVGPRPERPELAAQLEHEIPGFSQRLRVCPGLIGLAQALGSYHLHPRRKLRYDNLYISTMSPWLDLKLCALCLWNAIRAPRSPEAPYSTSAPPDGH